MTANNQVISCHECGLACEIGPLRNGERAVCPRCDHQLLMVNKSPYQGPIAYAATSLIALVTSIAYPFMSFSAQGISQEITLLEALDKMGQYDNAILSLLLMVSIIVLPAYFLICTIIMYMNASHLARVAPITRSVLKSISAVKPWLMVDVFLIGVLVSLIKIAALADIKMGISFWAFCCYSFLVVKTVLMVDTGWLWQRIFPDTESKIHLAGQSFQHHAHLTCHVCNAIHDYQAEEAKCNRCYAHLHHFKPNHNLQLAWALLLTAVVFFIPANFYPMMYTSSFGHKEGSTILGGVIILWNMGSYPVSMIIFLASIFIPMAKMFALAYLYWNAKRIKDLALPDSKRFLKLYRITEFIGRWSMIDIFVVAILVALVQLEGIMAMYPGPAALPFAIVVVSTMLSAIFFDSRIIWQ